MSRPGPGGAEGGGAPAGGAVSPLWRPPVLQAGDRVTVVATSGPVDPDRLRRGCDVLRRYGLEVSVAKHALDQFGTYLAGDDAVRADDFQEAWLDPQVSGILCARGGYGALRMIDLVDWDALAGAPPTLFAGSSDVTALHEAIASRLGVATLFAPMVATSVVGSGYGWSLDAFRRALFESWDGLRIEASRPWVLNRGVAQGVTVGGNLSLLAASVGSTFVRPAAGGLVFLEDVGEQPYRVDRLLTQLVRAGWLADVAGIALGTWIDCGPPDELEWVFRDRLEPLGVPVVGGFPAGHGARQGSFPLGVAAELDAGAAVLVVR